MQLISRKSSLAYLLIVLLAPGCARVPEKSVYGTYELKHSFGTERLVLEPAGRYVQDVTIDSLSVHHEGVWRYETDPKFYWIAEVVLVDALMVRGDFEELNPHYMTPVDGDAYLGVHRRKFGGIALGSEELKQLTKTK